MKQGADALYRVTRAPAAGDAFGALIARAQERMVIEVWPENWPAFRLFSRVGTQWRVGMNGPTGLSYEAVYPLMDRMQLSPDEWGLMLDDIAVLERQALTTMRETE